MSIKQMQIILPTNVSTLKSIESALKEYSNTLTQIESYKELNKDIIDSLNEKYDIPKKALSKLAVMYHKQERDKQVSEMNQLDEAYDSIFEKNKSQ